MLALDPTGENNRLIGEVLRWLKTHVQRKHIVAALESAGHAVHPTTVDKWCNGEQLPKGENLRVLLTFAQGIVAAHSPVRPGDVPAGAFEHLGSLADHYPPDHQKRAHEVLEATLEELHRKLTSTGPPDATDHLGVIIVPAELEKADAHAFLTCNAPDGRKAAAILYNIALPPPKKRDAMKAGFNIIVEAITPSTANHVSGFAGNDFLQTFDRGRRRMQ